MAKSKQCQHRTMRIRHGGHGDEFTCGDCGTQLPDPRGCQHLRIDNETFQCVACGEQMIGQTVKVETVLSAPNVAGCTNPACLAALEDGTYDETNPPAGCMNPNGIYVPGREQEIVVGWDYTYECERCRTNATEMTMDMRGMIWPCGGVHRGERVSARDVVAQS